MTARRAIAVAVACVLSAACSGNSASPSNVPSGATTIVFSALTGDGAPVDIYSENGYSLSTSGGWLAKTTFGNPAPFVQFVTPGGTPATGVVQVFATGHALFAFRSVDVYSSITPVPYTITGVRDFSTVFVMSDTVPNTFGAFRTIASTHPADPIDTLTIQLTNPATCCPNPIGIDNIALAR